jgi:hypothetical protein
MCFCALTRYQATDPKQAEQLLEMNFQPEAKMFCAHLQIVIIQNVEANMSRIMPCVCRLLSTSLEQFSTSSAQTSQIVIMDFIHSLCGLYFITCFKVRGNILQNMPNVYGSHMFNRLLYFPHMRSDCSSVHTTTVNKCPLAGCKLAGF